MEALFRHMAICCSAHAPAEADNNIPIYELACCMEQLHVAASPARDSSCRSSAIRSPRLRTSKACAAAAETASVGLPQYRIFTFDIETTGFSTTKDAIIEMAVVDVVSNDSWSSLIKPQPYRKSSRDAYKAHGISHCDLMKPNVPTPAAALEALQAFIIKHTAQQPHTVPLLVAHNGFNFDFKALAAAVHRQQQQRQQHCVAPGTSFGSSSSSIQMPQQLMLLDTLVLSRRLGLQKQFVLSNLQQATIREHFLGSPPALVHRALADSQELAVLLPHLLTWAAAHTNDGLDERLLPRSFASFMTAAAAAAAAAGTDDSCSNVEASNSNSHTSSRGQLGVAAAAESAVAATASRRSSNARSGRKTISSSGSSGNHRARKQTPSAVQQQQQGWNGHVNMAAAVAAAAATSLELSSDDECSNAAVKKTAAGEVSSSVSPVLKAASSTSVLTQAVGDCSQQPAGHSSSNGCSESSMFQSLPLSQQHRQSSSEAVGCAGRQFINKPAKAAAEPAATAAAAAAVVTARGLAGPGFVSIKGGPVPIMPSSSFLDLVQTSLLSSTSSDLPPGPLQLGRFVPGRLDPSSGFSEVLLGPDCTPCVFLVEGLVISKETKINIKNGQMQAASLFVKAASRQRAQQQHIKQVGAAVDDMTQLLPDQHQQHQQQQVRFSCMSGTSLQVRLPIKPGAPYLDATVRQLAQQTSSGGSLSSCSRRLVPVATPNLTAGDAATRLQQLLPVGSAVSVVLWPSCVWSNSRFRGVTLNGVEVWLQ